jgi:hypothetical protein
MSTIDIFYQGEGIPEVAHIEADAEQTFAFLKRAIAEKHGLDTEALLYLEDKDEPVEEQRVLREHAGGVGIKAHVHRCRHVHVEVTFNSETVHHEFGPGTTVARVKTWAAEHKFHMSPQDAGEHVLQIAGSKDRPDPGTHLGTLVRCPQCRVAFDLVPNERINGDGYRGESKL